MVAARRSAEVHVSSRLGQWVRQNKLPEQTAYSKCITEEATMVIDGDGHGMARKKVVRFENDIREYPSYSIEEVAEYIDVPKQTLRAWVSGYTYTSKSG